jgi:glutathione S-transferase
MKLYYSPGACSLSPHIVAREAGLAIEIERVDLPGKKLRKDDSDFWRINPTGMVPALQFDDGYVLTEGPAIVQYLADQAPASQLVPPCGTRERYEVQKWLNFVSTELHKSFTPLFRPTTPDAYKTISKENLAKRFALLDRHLAGKSYLMGETFTVADAYLFTVLNWTKFHAIDVGQWPHLKAYWERVRERPKVQEALKAEGLIKTA